MNKLDIFYYCMIFLILSVIFMFFIFNGKIVSKDVAECIGSKMTLYTIGGCNHCEKQKNRFGDSYQYLDVIDCANYPIICSGVGIVMTPTWVIDDSKHVGDRTIKELREISGC